MKNPIMSSRAREIPAPKPPRTMARGTSRKIAGRVVKSPRDRSVVSAGRWSTPRKASGSSTRLPATVAATRHALSPSGVNVSPAGVGGSSSA